MVWDVIWTLLLDPKSTKSFFISPFLKFHAVAAFKMPRGFSFFAVITAQRKPVRISKHLPAPKYRVLLGTA
jgi:hypothetical protein